MTNDGTVLSTVGLASAGGDATLDVVLKTRAVVVTGDLLGAGAVGEELLQQVKRTTHRSGRRIRTEVARTVIVMPPGEIDAREFVCQVDLDVWVRLVILQMGVVTRHVFLDERVLKQQRLALRLHDDVLKVADSLDQVTRLAVQPRWVSEVRAQSVTQADRFTHVEHLTPAVPHHIYAGATWDRREPCIKLFVACLSGCHLRHQV